MSAGSISVRLGAGLPSRSRFQYWNRLTDASRFMPPRFGLAPIGCFKVKQTGARSVVSMRFEAGCVPAGPALVHGRCALRLMSGLCCMPRPWVTVLIHGALADLKCAAFSQDFGRAMLDRPSRNFLGRPLFFCRPQMAAIGSTVVSRLSRYRLRTEVLRHHPASGPRRQKHHQHLLTPHGFPLRASNTPSWMNAS
jgi:hypothetical protein